MKAVSSIASAVLATTTGAGAVAATTTGVGAAAIKRTGGDGAVVTAAADADATDAVAPAAKSPGVRRVASYGAHVLAEGGLVNAGRQPQDGELDILG